MEKVLFIMKYLVGDNRNNLYTKFSGQIKAVEKLGYDVWYTAIDNNKVYLCNKNEKVRICSIASKKNKIKIWEQASFYNNFYKAIHNYIKRMNVNFSFSYIRSMFFCPYSIKLLKLLSTSNVKVIMEVPTHPAKNEYKKNSNILLKYALLIQHELTKLHSKYVDLFALMGESTNGSYFGSKAINIENGIEIESIPAKLKTENNGEIHVLAMATMANWHGYDRLIKGMYDYYENDGKEELVLHMVGNDGDGSLGEWKRLVTTLKLDDRVIFEGYLSGEQLQEIVNTCVVAVSSLGLYRKDMDVASELKTREYMARGIPFVYSTQDKMLNSAERFCYKVENCESNIDIDDIIQFVHNVQRDNDIVNDMRKYAEDNMSWEKQFIKIIRNIR